MQLCKRNRRYIILRSAQAFKKNGKIPYSANLKFLTFTVGVCGIKTKAVNIQMQHLQQYLIATLRELFTTFGGEIVTVWVGVLHNIELTDCINLGGCDIINKAMVCSEFDHSEAGLDAISDVDNKTINTRTVAVSGDKCNNTANFERLQPEPNRLQQLIPIRLLEFDYVDESLVTIGSTLYEYDIDFGYNMQILCGSYSNI